MSFDGLAIGAPFLAAMARRGITEPTPIQTLVIPRLTLQTGIPEGGAVPRPLLFTAPTGTGKTLAFLLPLLGNEISGNEIAGASDQKGWPRLLIAAPTYELCSQIKGEIDFLLEALSEPRPAASLLIGSAPLSRQIEGLKKTKPLAAVGNPARLLQLVRMKKLSLRSVHTLVLDEEDRLVSEELFPATAELVSLLPRGCRLIASTASAGEKSRRRLFSLCAGSPAESPARIPAGSLASGEPAEWEYVREQSQRVLRQNIEHWAIFAEERKKISMLRSFLAAIKPRKALVFSSRTSQVGNIVSQLQYHHLAAGGIWGDMEKKARKAAMDGFRRGSLSVLVASDLAARGLDIEGLSHIIALDVPESEETYLHRAGRTGRAGKRGIMVSMGEAEEMRRLARIEKKLGIIVYPKELRGGNVTAPEPL